MIQSDIFDSINMNIKKITNLILLFIAKRLTEIFGILILISGILLLISLISYSAEDPNFIFPENADIKNLLGFKGSYISDLFFQSVGLVSYLFSLTLIFTGLNIALSKDLFLISDVFEGEPNLSSKFCEKNYYFTPHIAGHSQFSRYAMTRMAFHNVAEYLNIDVIEPESILVNKEQNRIKETINDFKNFLFPVSLILKTYNFTKDVFEPSLFKKIRDNYNDRLGFSQVNIKDCNDPKIKKSLEILGFKVI